MLPRTSFEILGYMVLFGYYAVIIVTLPGLLCVFRKHGGIRGFRNAKGEVIEDNVYDNFDAFFHSKFKRNKATKEERDAMKETFRRRNIV